MRRSLLLPLAAALCLLALPASAQKAAAPQEATSASAEVKIGLGVEKTELTGAAESREQRTGVPQALIAPDLLEADIWNARAHAAIAQLLAQQQPHTERAADADALLALVRVER